MTPIRALVLAALALALWLTAGIASADEPTDPQTATRLHPGINLIGWVGEPTPVAQLFREIPQLEAVWAWDAELDDWIVAARNAPEWLGGLGRVTAGMGLRMQLSGDAPVIWDRSTEPTRGLVKLRTGWNLVAWSGADGAPIENVAKGIGWSLRSIRRWDAATQQWATWTSPERSAQVIADTGGGEEPAPPGVRRGEALWVNVSRSVKWLQPTDILPRLVFPGGASQAVQAHVREDLEAVLSHYRDQYGIQADPDFTFYVPKDVDALIQAYKDDGVEVDDAGEASIRALWNTAFGWGGGRIVVKQSSWQTPTDVLYLLTHEYFHTLQFQLSEGWAAHWLVEGMGYWSQDEHSVMDGFSKVTWPLITNSTPTLRSTESANGTWHYMLGHLATDLLTADAGPDSWIEFWRHLVSTKIGPHGRWTSSPDWRAAFEEVFGMPVADFYVRFGSWQREQAQRNSATTTDSDDDARWIRGRVTREGGAPVAGVFINAIRVEGETSVGRNQRAETDATGAFVIRVFQEGDYRLSVDINDDCTRYYSDGELIDGQGKARTVVVGGSDLSGVDIQLPPNVCGWQIRGRVVDSDGEPLGGVAITACRTDGNCTWGERTESDGAFAVPAAKPGDYRLHLDLVDGCSVYHSRSGPTFGWDDASLITVADADVGGIVMRVSTDICHLRVGGSVNGIERFLDGYVSVDLCQIVDNECRSTTSRRAGDDGSFAVAVPVAGAYRLTYNLDGCAIHYGSTGLTSNTTDAALIHIGERDMRVGYRQIPADVCGYQIKGSITTSNGQPLADTYIWACREVEDECVDSTGRWTDSTGMFAITVRTEGRYRLNFNLEGCTIYFRRGGFTTARSERSTVRVEGRSVRLNPRQIPAELCGYQIKGSITTSNGQPLADTYIWACREVEDECVDSTGRWTDSTGMFAITVRTEGRYRLGFNFGGCTIYFRSGGFTTDWQDRSTVRVEGRSVRLNPRQFLAEMCAHQIKGSITTSDGQPLTDTRVWACHEADNHCTDWVGWNNTAADGSFDITVPTEGEYRLSFQLEGCSILFRRGGLTTTFSERLIVRVEGRSVRLNPRQIPTEMCAHRISGRLVDAAGAPLAEKHIFAHSPSAGVSDQTDANGRFEIRVPADGAYEFGILFRSQPRCWYGFAGRALGSPDRPVRVSGADVTGIEFRLPDTIENLCK